jgi:hypothetical protein
MDRAYRGCLTARGYSRAKRMEPAPSGSYRGMDDEGFSVSGGLSVPAEKPR